MTPPKTHADSATKPWAVLTSFGTTLIFGISQTPSSLLAFLAYSYTHTVHRRLSSPTFSSLFQNRLRIEETNDVKNIASPRCSTLHQTEQEQAADSQYSAFHLFEKWQTVLIPPQAGFKFLPLLKSLWCTVLFTSPEVLPFKLAT